MKRTSTPAKPASTSAAPVDPHIERMVDDVLRGVRNVAWARIGDVSIPVRALAEPELDDATELARTQSSAQLDGATPHAELVAQLSDRHVLARAVLDPESLVLGRYEPLFRAAAELEALDAEIAIMLADAQRRAQRCALPHLDAAGVEELGNALRARADARPLEHVRAIGESAARYYGLDRATQVTGWQSIFFAAISPRT